MPSYFLIIVFGLTIIIWLGVLTFLIYRYILSNGTQNYNSGEKEIGHLKKQISNLQQNELKHIQKIGVLRFNPFNETGGDNSFTLCLLDGKDNGIVLTGLHTREKTRVYAKKIVDGKSDYELSSEEKRALEEALK